MSYVAQAIVNVLLPSTFTWAKLIAWAELATKAFDRYRHCLGLAVNNVERLLRNQHGRSRYLVNSAQSIRD